MFRINMVGSTIQMEAFLNSQWIRFSGALPKENEKWTSADVCKELSAKLLVQHLNWLSLLGDTDSIKIQMMYLV